jgi:hypothetical protein
MSHVLPPFFKKRSELIAIFAGAALSKFYVTVISLEATVSSLFWEHKTQLVYPMAACEESQVIWAGTRPLNSTDPQADIRPMRIKRVYRKAACIQSARSSQPSLRTLVEAEAMSAFNQMSAGVGGVAARLGGKVEAGC